MKTKCLTLLTAFIIVLIITAPYLLTRPAFCKSLIFDSTGQIGDTIGGITAPIIGIFSIIVLVMTLRAQLKFNNDQSKDNLVSQLVMIQSDIIHCDERLSFTVIKNGQDEIKLSGIDTVSLLYSGNNNQLYIHIPQAFYLLAQIETLLCLCNSYYCLLSANVVLGEDKEKFMQFMTVYSAKVFLFLNAISENKLNIKPNIFELQDDQDAKMPSELDRLRQQAKKDIESYTWLK